MRYLILYLIDWDNVIVCIHNFELVSSSAGWVRDHPSWPLRGVWPLWRKALRPRDVVLHFELCVFGMHALRYGRRVASSEDWCSHAIKEAARWNTSNPSSEWLGRPTPRVREPYRLQFTVSAALRLGTAASKADAGEVAALLSRSVVAVPRQRCRCSLNCSSLMGLTLGPELDQMLKKKQSPNKS